MRDKLITIRYYTALGFSSIGALEWPHYLMLKKGHLEVHFFRHDTLDVHTNDGQLYFRVKEIEAFYQKIQTIGIKVHPNGALQTHPWGQKEFSLLDPDHNLLTFGESMADPSG